MTGTVLAISPHLDDAVMSVGASMSAITRAGHRVVIGTVFAGSPRPPFSTVATEFHADCGLGDDGMTQRRAEDRNAAQTVGAEVVHLRYLDAIYRRYDGWLCVGSRSMFDPELPDELGMRESISADIQRLVERVRPVAVWTCDTLGGHVDHRIANAATRQAGRLAGWVPLLWESLPYAFDASPPEAPHCPVGVPVADVDIDRKLAAIARYRSQLGMLWPGDQDWRSMFREHVGTRRPYGGPELMWRAPDGHSSQLAVSLTDGGSS